MGAIKNIWTARQEYAEKLSEALGESVEILENQSPVNSLEWWKFRLEDGVVVSKIDDLTYIEPAPIECGAKDFDEIRTAIDAVRARHEEKEDN
jgi:hypothetical protein